MLSCSTDTGSGMPDSREVGDEDIPKDESLLLGDDESDDVDITPEDE